jgi:hypothetical protein
MLRDQFLAAGGAIFERTSFRSAEYAKDGIAIKCARAWAEQTSGAELAPPAMQLALALAALQLA